MARVDGYQIQMRHQTIPWCSRNICFSCITVAGLGDIAVPGLLACLALRYDASRAINMGARADAAAEALKGAFLRLDVSLLCRLIAWNHMRQEGGASMGLCGYEELLDTPVCKAMLPHCHRSPAPVCAKVYPEMRPFHIVHLGERDTTQSMICCWMT